MMFIYKKKESAMSLDLTLLPFGCDTPELSFSHSLFAGYKCTVREMNGMSPEESKKLLILECVNIDNEYL